MIKSYTSFHNFSQFLLKISDDTTGITTSEKIVSYPGENSTKFQAASIWNQAGLKKAPWDLTLK